MLNELSARRNILVASICLLASLPVLAQDRAAGQPAEAGTTNKSSLPSRTQVQGKAEVIRLEARVAKEVGEEKHLIAEESATTATTLEAGSGQPSSAEDQTPQQPTPAPAGDADALRKASQNPVASLISVPIQYNMNFGQFGGPDDRIQSVTNLQPVIPFQLGRNWNLVARIIQPIVYQPDVSSPKHEGWFGLGDMNPTFFFVPAKPGKVIWGVGPAFVIPTATNQQLGQGKFSMGPSIVALIQPGKWTVGALANNVWSVAGKDGRAAVNQLLLQYFVNYNLPKGYYLAFQPIITANWRAKEDRWVVPFGGGIGRITKLGPQPVNISFQLYGTPIRPANASPFGLRFQLTFLYPKAPKP